MKDRRRVRERDLPSADLLPGWLQWPLLGEVKDKGVLQVLRVAAGGPKQFFSVSLPGHWQEARLELEQPRDQNYMGSPHYRQWFYLLSYNHGLRFLVFVKK